MVMNNRFVILTPSYNNSDWVEYNLASILNQTYTNWKLVYMDDNSSDDTLSRVTSIMGKDDRCTIIHNSINLGAMHNYFENLHHIEDNDIVLHVDGDDWLVDENVLNNLNNLYNKTNCWMTYGGMVVWDGTDVRPAYPQNTRYDSFVSKYKKYREDSWRASHLRTFRGFLLKSINKSDLKDLQDNKYYYHASDLAFQFACMEMSGEDRIQAVDFLTYVYNQHPSVVNRTRSRENSSNTRYEIEIRNRKRFKLGLSGEKFPLVNVLGDYKERNSIATDFVYVYNQTQGEFDITLIQDDSCVKYINGHYGTLPGIIVADLHEPPHLFEQQSVYSLVEQNWNKFDYILTYNERLLQLPNAIFRNGGYECVLNKNIHALEHPLLADEGLFNTYSKSKGVSFITSNKTFTELHVFRNNCVSSIKNSGLAVDVFGVGYNYIKQKLDGLKDYKYSVAIENGVANNYFTEKLLDCFLTGTIPIYKGCPNIEKFFNLDGIIVFDTIEDLKKIVDRANRGDYNVPHEIVLDNYRRALQYCYNNDRFFDKYLRKMLTNLPKKDWSI